MSDNGDESLVCVTDVAARLEDFSQAMWDDENHRYCAEEEMNPLKAREAGKKARSKGAMRVTPFYEVIQIVDGAHVDVTDELDRAWLAGYDEPLELGRKK